MLRVHSGLPFLSGPAAPPGLHDLGCLGVTTPGRAVRPYRDRRSVRPCLRHDHLSFPAGAP